MNFTIKYSFDIETRQYVAEIPELHLSDFGDTMNDAEKNIKTVLSLYIDEITANQTKSDHKNLQYA